MRLGLRQLWMREGIRRARRRDIVRLTVRSSPDPTRHLHSESNPPLLVTRTSFSKSRWSLQHGRALLSSEVRLLRRQSVDRIEFQCMRLCIDSRSPHLLASNQLVRKEIDTPSVWAGGRQYVLCVRLYKLRQSRVGQAFVTTGQTINNMLAVHRHIDTPFLNTKPSTTGVTLAVDLPISMTSAEPFPAAKLHVTSRTKWKRGEHSYTMKGEKREILLTR